MTPDQIASEKYASLRRGLDRLSQDCSDFLHDIDGSRRSSALFNDPDLSRARDLVEDVVEIVQRVLASR